MIPHERTETAKRRTPIRRCMRVSVVVCGYDPSLFDDLVEAVESVLAQTHDDIELVIVVDGTDALYHDLVAEFGETEDVVLHCNDENLGLSRSRNVGVGLASGDVVAFMDDDAVAHPDWIEKLLATYDRRDALAVGGRMAPRWVAGKPEYLPPEFYWLIGVTYRGYPEEETMVRNTFGSNISFRADILDELGGFEPQLGLVGDRQIQGEETELAARMQAHFDEGVWYNPDAIVEHKIFEHRTDPVWLTKRAFWQGYSKRVMAEFLPADGREDGEESEFLKRLVTKSVPERLRGLVANLSLAAVLQLVIVCFLTGAVGFGYLYAVVARWLS